MHRLTCHVKRLFRRTKYMIESAIGTTFAVGQFVYLPEGKHAMIARINEDSAGEKYAIVLSKADDNSESWRTNERKHLVDHVRRLVPFNWKFVHTENYYLQRLKPAPKPEADNFLSD